MFTVDRHDAVAMGCVVWSRGRVTAACQPWRQRSLSQPRMSLTSLFPFPHFLCTQ